MAGSGQMLFMMQSCMATHIQSMDSLISGAIFWSTMQTAKAAPRALSNLEFFVHCDVMMTQTASLADIFLPVNTPWEREALRVGFEGSQAAANLIQFRQAATESAGESRSDAFIVFQLAKSAWLR